MFELTMFVECNEVGSGMMGTFGINIKFFAFGRTLMGLDVPQLYEISNQAFNSIYCNNIIYSLAQ